MKGLSRIVVRKQRIKINDAYSSWLEIIFGVPQGSILGPLRFNIFLCDLFYTVTDIDITSYADDTTPYIFKNSTEEVIQKLETSTKERFQWFLDNRAHDVASNVGGRQLKKFLKKFFVLDRLKWL